MIENFRYKDKFGRTTVLTLDVLCSLSVITFLFSLFCFLYLDITKVVFYALFIYSVLNTINVLLFFKHNNILKTYLISSYIGFLTVLVISFYSGGINSPAISFLVLLVFFGYLIKKVYGNTLLILVTLSVIAFYLINVLNYVLVNEITKENNAEFNLIFLLFLIIILGGVFGRMMNKTNLKISQAKKEIVRKNDEKTVMLKEIHHRVKNNLQVVNSLLRIQSRSVVDENVKMMFKVAQSRVIAMARLHEKIYNTKDLKNIDVGEHFKLLLSDLISSNNLGKEISSKLNIQHIAMSIDTLLPLSLIVNELISNSLKHAFNGVEKGEVKVELILQDNTQCKLIVSDNGSGVDKDILSGANNSTGITLIKTFARQLNGTITILKNINGASFELTFTKI